MAKNFFTLPQNVTAVAFVSFLQIELDMASPTLFMLGVLIRKHVHLALVMFLVILFGNAKGNQNWCVEMFSDSECLCSINATTTLSLECPDASAVPWDHLEGTSFRELILTNFGRGQLTMFAFLLPTMPSVITLRIHGYNNQDFSIPSPTQLPNLENLVLNRNKLTNEDIERLLRTWTETNLKNVDLQYNELTVYPKVLSLLPNLSVVKLKSNKLTSLNNEAPLSFSVPVVEIDLSNNNIHTIETVSVFRGNLSLAKILIEGNPIFSDLRNAVVLVALAKRVSVINFGNIDCSSCFMAPFAASNPDLLAAEKVTGACINGKRFHQLKPENYPVEECPRSSSSGTGEKAKGLQLLVVILIVMCLT